MSTEFTNGGSSNTGASNATGDTGHERKPTTLTLDQAAMKSWLSGEVVLTLPRWALVAAGVLTFVLLMLALD
jgi:hypothetical protein